MLGFKSSREKERYYLLAGMGGAPSRRKRNLILACSVIVAILVAFGAAALFAFLDRLPVN